MTHFTSSRPNQPSISLKLDKFQTFRLVHSICCIHVDRMKRERKKRYVKLSLLGIKSYSYWGEGDTGFLYIDKSVTAPKWSFSLGKCGSRKLWIWSHLLKQSLMENSIFCVVCLNQCHNFKDSSILDLTFCWYSLKRMSRGA